MSSVCEIGWSDAGHSRSGDMEDGVPLDVRSFSVLQFCLLLYFIASLDLGPVQAALALVFTTSGDKSSGGGVSPCAASAK